MNKLFWLMLALIILVATYVLMNNEPEHKQERKQWQPPPAEEILNDIQKPAMPEEGGIGGSGHIIDCQDKDPNCEGKLP